MSGCHDTVTGRVTDAMRFILPDEIVDFTLDRPFLFAITGDDGPPLFAGVVNEP